MEYAGKSKIGLVRSVNQDRILAFKQGEIALFAVADGMGGHIDGEKASQMIIDTLGKWCSSIKAGEFEKNFFKLVTSAEHCIEQANQMIYEKYQPDIVCGSTVSILLIYESCYAIFHVGDSRIYQLEKGKLNQLTIDEVWENDIRTRRKFTDKEIKASSKRGKLINAIGTAPELVMTIKTDELQEETLFLLCSDGLYKMLKPREVTRILKKVNKNADPEWGVEELMKKVYRAGAKDNISIVIIKTGK